MKNLSILSLIAGLSASLVYAYDECSTCKVYYVEDGVQWGVENKDWCSKF